MPLNGIHHSINCVVDAPLVHQQPAHGFSTYLCVVSGCVECIIAQYHSLLLANLYRRVVYLFAKPN